MRGERAGCDEDAWILGGVGLRDMAFWFRDCG
jgi:hypothetical protein